MSMQNSANAAWVLGSSGGDTSGLAADVTAGQLGSAGVQANPSALSPDHPMFWVAITLALAGGLIGASTHLKAGPFRVSGSAGKS